jgi:hypothetical protein
MNTSALLSLLKLSQDVLVPPELAPDIDRYLFERYVQDKRSLIRKIYYLMKPLMPRSVQLGLRRKYSRVQAETKFPAWPIEPVIVDTVRNTLTELIRRSGPVCRIAPWPDRKRFAFAITHDVEWDSGLRFAPRIAALEKNLGMISSWNIVPERYPIDWSIIERFRADGFEIGVHGLHHDGKLYKTEEIFKENAKSINRYAKDWGSTGFRGESTLRNPDWMQNLQIEWDSSFPDTDPYEPQAGGCCSIWPFFVHHIVELPITLPQDHTIFEILSHRDISTWKAKTDWIEEHSGLVLVNVHPDYMMTEERFALYEEFLLYMKTKRDMWQVVPGEMARWWRARNDMVLRTSGERYTVEGPMAERASVLKASLENGVLVEKAL